MPSHVIPKEQLTAYQRWELLGIEEVPGAGEGEAASRSSKASVPLSLPTAEELENIHQQSAQEGFKIGHEEGYKAGYENGRQAGAADAGRLETLLQALDKEAVLQDENLANALLDLALAIAGQMVKTALTVREGLVLEALREAMNNLPELSGHLRVVVHPSDLQSVNAFLAGEHAHATIRAIADPQLERGGFRIESNHCEVDGELKTRWQEIVDSLGADHSWLEQG